jgi:hypothetical protein
LLVTHFGKLYADPAAHANIGRPKIYVRRLFNQSSLHSGCGGQPHGDSAVTMVIICEHGEHPLWSEKDRLAMGDLFGRAWKQRANAA